MGQVVVAARAGTAFLGIWLDGRFLRRVRVANPPTRVAVPLPVGHHEVRVRARGPGGVRWAPPRSLWVLPASARRARGIGGWVDAGLQRDVDAMVRRLPVNGGAYVQHLVTGCGAAVNAGARFPPASTLKAAILIEAERRFGGRPSRSMSGLLDAMIIDSSNGAANRVLSVLGGGSTLAGSHRVTETLRRMGLRESVVWGPYQPASRPRRSPAIRVRVTDQPAIGTNVVATPYELARIMVGIHRGMRGAGPLPRIGVSSLTARTEIVPRLLRVRDRSKIVAGAPRGVLVAHKSGYTGQVKHDAGIVYLPSGPVVVAAMTWSGSGVGATGSRFIADVAGRAAGRLRRGGHCG